MLLLQVFCFAAMADAKSGIPDIFFSNETVDENKINDTDTTYRIITKPDKTYGYEIVVNDKTLIRQNTIPGQQGVQGFKRKNDAEQVALLVIKKLQLGIMPPTINKEELKQLNIIF
jgi:hypothetical protein